MASSPRIDELKKKFDENPRRYFAPLANEYRKAGDLEQAIQLCRAYLPQQPGHMSGHIVFGQALFESGQFEEAKGVFETALGLDPENLIALRHLGDIARQGGDIGGARGWYQRVLDADPRNDEIAAQLAALPADAPAPTEQPAAASEPAKGTDGGMGSWGEVNPETSAPAAPAAQSASPLTELDSFELRDTLRTKAVTPPIGTASQAPNAAAEPEFERDGEGAFAMPSPEAATRGVEGVERSEEIQLRPRTEPNRETLVGHAPDAPPAAKPDAPRAADKQSFGSSNEFGFETMEFVPPSREGDHSSPPPNSPAGAFGVPFTGENAPAEETPAAFVTETMAELYLQQGFTQEALAVYRQLLAKNPDDAGLRERIASLEHGKRSSVAVAAVSDEVIEHAEQRRHAREPETIRSFFSALMRRRVLQRFIDLGTGSTADEPAPDAEQAPQRPVATLADVPSLAATDEYASASTQWSERSAPADEVPAATHASDDAFIIPEGVALPPGVNPEDAESTGAPLEDEPRTAEPRPSEPAPQAIHEAPRAVETAPPAAVQTAPAGANAQPAAAEGNGTIDSLFGGTGGTSEDERAASVLSGAFPTVQNGTLEGRPAERAKNELSLDHVFREAERKTRASGSFSFDQFFSEGGSAPKPANRTTDPGASSVGGPDLAPDDDVAQFNDWLSGLKKK
ncbi:MAG TPA: tetratricopeptide repeat protein [Gemmatimonadaceae bacterium]|nr:tetratricopeptide repeat protein [Gemmatimonadaceae bacterium]